MNQQQGNNIMTTTTATTTALPTGTWQLDTSSTTVTVAARKMGLFTVPADLIVTSGGIEIDDSHQVVAVDIVADAASYASKNDKRNKHILSDDFLDVSAHPTISFHCGDVVRSDDVYRANGTVTIKGQTSPVDVTIADLQFTDNEGTFTASATIDRNAIGVDKLPNFIIGRNLVLSVSAQATRKP
jgi:polyisoprenoid-binding protein YceI